MGLWILEDKYLGRDVPGRRLLWTSHCSIAHDLTGTSLLEDIHDHSQNTHAPGAVLKRTKDGIALIPQPTDSPNDPLNWPFWRKCTLMITITYGTGVVGAFLHIINAGFVQVAQNLSTSVAQLSRMSGDGSLTTGLVLVLIAPASVVWGRRPIFLLGNALLLASLIWGARAKSLGDLVASRVLGGMGTAPIECLVEVLIA